MYLILVPRSRMPLYVETFEDGVVVDAKKYLPHLGPVVLSSEVPIIRQYKGQDEIFLRVTVNSAEYFIRAGDISDEAGAWCKFWKRACLHNPQDVQNMFDQVHAALCRYMQPRMLLVVK
jgi:hypothetical protein